MHSLSSRKFHICTTTRTQAQTTGKDNKMSQPLRAAILIVSTTVANGSTVDTAGPMLRGIFDTDSSGKWSVVGIRKVSDDVEQIQTQIKTWTDDGMDGGADLIVTTGGTGFAVTDQTPEVYMFVVCLAFNWTDIPAHRPCPRFYTSTPLVSSTACWLLLSA